MNRELDGERMKATATILLAAGLAALTSCQTQQSLAKNQAEAQAWLDSAGGPARIQVAGTWFSEDWGRADLTQKGRDISGRLDTYEVRGVASGDTAYLTTWDSGKCYYAVILKASGRNSLTGSYTDGPAYRSEAKEQRTVEFRRSY